MSVSFSSHTSNYRSCLIRKPIYHKSKQERGVAYLLSIGNWASLEKSEAKEKFYQLCWGCNLM